MRRLLLALLFFALHLVVRPAGAQEISPLDAKAHADNARREGFYAFCTHPPQHLFGRHRSMCSLASEVKGCEALVAACREEAEPDLQKSSLLETLGAIAQKLVWLLVALGIVALLYPILRALRKARADKALTDPAAKVEQIAKAPAAPEIETISDAEAALRAADDLVRRGELDRAMSLYLAASLVALDRRGAVRLAKHRTNGEYVRLCTEPDARQPLREIVREVDKIEFGDVRPTEETASLVAARAQALVRRGPGAAARAASALTSVFFLLLLGAGALGCNLPKGLTANDPVGDELPQEVLRRTGYVVARPETSLATLPIPEGHVDLPLVVVDRDRVPLDDEARAHLLRWVEAGGVLVLFGVRKEWPEELELKEEQATTRDLDIVVDDGVDFTGAKVATPAAFTCKNGEAIAKLGDHVYAARVVRGGGAIVAVAGNDLFTNVGAAIPANAAALVAILETARSPRPALVAMSEQADTSTMPFFSSKRILIAHEEDGFAPPSNPFSSLARAGLGKGLWHALAASLVLFLAFGIRHARPRPTATPARRAFTEHVEATGAFYGRTRAFAHALAAYGRFAELRVRERLPRGADPVAFLASRASAPHDEVARVWGRAMAAKADEPTRGDELVTIRELRALLVKALDL